MQEANEDIRDLLYKMAVYIPGVILGLSAKLSRLNRERKLTWREGIFQTAVAFSSAWVIWFALEYLGYQKLSAPAAVVCGRFGDEIMIWVWKYTKLMISSTLKSFK